MKPEELYELCCTCMNAERDEDHAFIECGLKKPQITTTTCEDYKSIDVELLVSLVKSFEAVGNVDLVTQLSEGKQRVLRSFFEMLADSLANLIEKEGVNRVGIAEVLLLAFCLGQAHEKIIEVE